MCIHSQGAPKIRSYTNIMFIKNVWFGMSYGALYCLVFVISTSMILPFLDSSANCMEMKSCVSICINY